MSIDKQALHSLMRSNVTDDMINFLTNRTLKVIKTVTDVRYPTPPSSPMDALHQGLPSLSTFIRRLVKFTNVYTPTLLTAAVYLERLQAILPNDATGVPSTTHRMFLACLILSAKNHNDSSPLNKHWTKYTEGLFTLEDVNLMERQLLQLLNWNMVVSEQDLLSTLDCLLEPIKQTMLEDERKAMVLPTPVSSPVEENKSRGGLRVSLPKLYNMPRNDSVASNISSSSTLIGSSSNLRKTANITESGSRWALEQLMSRHGF